MIRDEADKMCGWGGCTRTKGHPADDRESEGSHADEWPPEPSQTPRTRPIGGNHEMSRNDTAKSQEAADCICGATIHRTPLPDDIAKLSGQTFIWIHDHGGDIYCYPDDENATATPARA